MQSLGEDSKGAMQPDRLTGREWLAVLALTLLAAILRLPTLGHASLWFDELATWTVVNQSSLQALVTKGLANDVHLPGYFVITYGLVKAFGDGEFVLRLPAAAFGILSVPAIFILGRRLFGSLTGFISAMILTLSYTGIYYAQEARPYSMMMFLGIVTTHLWHRLFVKVIVEGEKASASEVGFLWLALAAFCYTHYFDVILVAMQGAFFLWHAKKWGRGVDIPAWIFGGLLLCALPWVPQLALQVRAHQQFWIPLRHPVEAVGDVVSFLFGASLYMGVVGVVVALVGVLPFGFGILQQEGSRDRKVSALLVAACIVPFLVVEGISLAGKPIFVDRYLSYSLPLAYIVIARQFARLKLGAVVRVAIAGVPLVIALVMLERSGHLLSDPQKDDWRDTFAAISEKSPPYSRVALFSVTEQVGVSEYYARQYGSKFVIQADVAAASQVPEALNRVMATSPDYIWVFLGQVVQPWTGAAADAAMAKIPTIATRVYTVTNEEHSLGAVLFRVDKAGQGAADHR